MIGHIKSLRQSLQANGQAVLSEDEALMENIYHRPVNIVNTYVDGLLSLVISKKNLS